MQPLHLEEKLGNPPQKVKFNKESKYKIVTDKELWKLNNTFSREKCHVQIFHKTNAILTVYLLSRSSICFNIFVWRLRK